MPSPFFYQTLFFRLYNWLKMKPSAHVRREVQRQKKDHELAEIAKLEKLLSEQAPEKGVREKEGERAGASGE